jgi:hypothetical protein
MRLTKPFSIIVAILLLTVLFAELTTVPTAAQYNTMQALRMTSRRCRDFWFD